MATKRSTKAANPSTPPDVEEKDLLMAKAIMEEIEEKKPTLIPLADISVDGLAPWSISKYKTLAKCPFYFYLKYVVRIKIPEAYSEVTDSSVRTEIGRLIHLVLEYMVVGDITFHQALGRVVDEKDYNKEILSDKYWHLVESLEIPAREFYSRMQAVRRKYPVKEVRAEGNMAVDRNWNPVDYFSEEAYLRGLLDLNIIMENGDCLLLDHKLGGAPERGIGHHRFQLETYGAMNVHSNEEILAVIPGIHFVEAMDVVLGQRMTKEYLTRTVRNNMDMHIYNAVEHVKTVGYFKAERCTLCQYCEFRDLCAKYRKPRDKNSIAGLLQPIMLTSGEVLKRDTESGDA